CVNVAGTAVVEQQNARADRRPSSCDPRPRHPFDFRPQKCRQRQAQRAYATNPKGLTATHSRVIDHQSFILGCLQPHPSSLPSPECDSSSHRLDPCEEPPTTTASTQGQIC